MNNFLSVYFIMVVGFVDFQFISGVPNRVKVILCQYLVAVFYLEMKNDGQHQDKDM